MDLGKGNLPSDLINLIDLSDHRQLSELVLTLCHRRPFKIDPNKPLKINPICEETYRKLDKIDEFVKKWEKLGLDETIVMKILENNNFDWDVAEKAAAIEAEAAKAAATEEAAKAEAKATPGNRQVDKELETYLIKTFKMKLGDAIELCKKYSWNHSLVLSAAAIARAQAQAVGKEVIFRPGRGGMKPFFIPEPAEESASEPAEEESASEPAAAEEGSAAAGAQRVLGKDIKIEGLNTVFDTNLNGVYTKTTDQQCPYYYKDDGKIYLYWSMKWKAWIISNEIDVDIMNSFAHYTDIPGPNIICPELPTGTMTWMVNTPVVEGPVNYVNKFKMNDGVSINYVNTGGNVNGEGRMRGNRLLHKTRIKNNIKKSTKRKSLKRKKQSKRRKRTKRKSKRKRR